MEQFERAQRYLMRLRAVYAGKFADSLKEQDYEDDVLSFFMHCYHIKDWIAFTGKDAALVSKQIDTFIDKNECLKICTDLCNGTKHCVLTRSTRTGNQPQFTGKEYDYSTWLVGSGGGEVVKAKYSINTSSGSVDALALAEDCMRSWSIFLARTNS